MNRLRVFAEGLDPVHIGFTTKPGELALGVIAMALLGEGDSLGLIDFAANQLERLPVAEGVEGFHRAVAFE